MGKSGVPLPMCKTILILLLIPVTQRSCVCTLDEFNIYTREAGAGILSVAIEGPSPAKIELVDNPNGYSMVSYIVTKDGRFDDYP